MYQRGDIVEVNLGMPPDGKILNHPAVIISNEDVYNDDDCYIVVMLTSQKYDDKYSFEVSDHMLATSSGKFRSEARCHLVTYILNSHIVVGKHRSRLRRQYVDALVEHMVNCSLY